MPRLRTRSGIEIEYDEFGSPEAAPVVLVMGLGAQMILWDEAFCEGLVARGYRAIRFDNRDIGLSTHLREAGVPNVMEALVAAARGGPVDAPYTLADMADDVVALLDELGLESAHVVGASMGGMIAQTLAIRRPERLRTLTSIMSTTGARDLPQARPEAIQALLVPPPAEREANIARMVEVMRTIGSPGFPFEEERARAIAARCFDRSYDPAGFARQFTAILASGSRREALRSVEVATLVIHGADDPLIPVEAGIDTARAVPGAELMVIEGMGHDLPRPVWPRIYDALGKLSERVGG